jgi:dTDP-4-amino-4,6-dideoxygalactose transaminase
MRVPFLELAADFAAVREDVERRFQAVLESQAFVLGDQGRELEASLGRLTGAADAIACSSGSDALYLATLALGIGPGDAVLVPAFTFFASAGAIHRAGAVPVFTDVDPATLNVGARELACALDRTCSGPVGARVHRASGARVKALVAVHLYGRAAAMSAIGALAADERLAIVEDAAQAIGATGELGPVGAWGDVGCFSFYPTKNVGGAGDGGALTTREKRLANHLRRLRVHGAETSAHVHEECGINARLGELQAAYVNAKLGRLAAWTRERERLAADYRRRLAALVARERLTLPPEAPAGGHVYHQFVVRIAGGRRDEVQARLVAEGVDTRVFYPLPLHLQPCFAFLEGKPGDLPNAESAAQDVLCLPIYPTLGEDRLGIVCERLAAVLAS